MGMYIMSARKPSVKDSQPWPPAWRHGLDLECSAVMITSVGAACGRCTMPQESSRKPKFSSAQHHLWEHVLRLSCLFFRLETRSQLCIHQRKERTLAYGLILHASYTFHKGSSPSPHAGGQVWESTLTDGFLAHIMYMPICPPTFCECNFFILFNKFIMG